MNKQYLGLARWRAERHQAQAHRLPVGRLCGCGQPAMSLVDIGNGYRLPFCAQHRAAAIAMQAYVQRHPVFVAAFMAACRALHATLSKANPGSLTPNRT